MAYIIPQETKDRELLQSCGISPSEYESILATIRQANDRYYHLSPRHEHFYKMLNTGDYLLKKDRVFQKLPLKEQKEWSRIRNIKTGDRAYLCRYLITELKRSVPEIVTELIEPRFRNANREAQTDPLDLASDIDALLLAASVPRYFEYMDRLTDHKKSVFNPLQRAYASFIHIRALNLAAAFLQAFEQNLTVLKAGLFQNGNLQLWSFMSGIIGDLCDQADPNHHDALSTQAVNCLRSIYISIFNFAMQLLCRGEAVPIELRRFLPLIPDRLDFSRQTLEEDEAWNRYQDHQFLFMRLPREQRELLGECLARLTPAERVVWMGCLGRSEIHDLILQIVTQQNQLINLGRACRDIQPSDEDNHHFSARVWEILRDIYTERLRDQPGTPQEIHQLFSRSLQEVAGKERSPKSDEKKPAEKPKPDADLTLIQDLSFLVVDDSMRMRQMTKKVLKEAGIEAVVEAADGLEAWKILQERSVDVILCDWIMPEMTGIELVQKVMQLEEMARSTTFIMLTTVNNKASIVEALSVGVRGYLIKPFTRKQLLEKVFFATEWLRKEQQSA